MNRRDTVFALVALGVAPLASFAQQQGKIWRVGVLALRQVAFLESDYTYGPFRRGMRELGYVEGKNLVIEWRSADGKFEHLPALAAELVQLKVDVIVTAGAAATSVAQKATATIPIVMGATNDPLGSGFVMSLARPGGNITGLSLVSADISSKHVEMLLSVVPKLSLVAILLNPTNAGHSAILESTEAAARVAKVKILAVKAQTQQEIEDAFSLMVWQHAGAIIIMADAFFNQQARQIAELALKNRLPSISGGIGNAEAGGLLNYGMNVGDSYRRAATYVDKILKGVKPGDLPVEQPTKFELVVNMKTAKALGTRVPPLILMQADRVIE